MFGSTPTPKRVGRHGIIRWEISCPERGCGKTLTADDKPGAKKAWKKHDTQVHKPQRQRAAKDEKSLKARQAKALADAERKARLDAARDAGRRRNQAAKQADENRGWHATKPSSGLRTKGIKNVPDGQKVTGVVYDKDGKPVPYHVLKKHVQGWD